MPSELINVAHPFYNSPSVHLGMLRDRVRTLAFEAALRKLVRQETTVLDLGTGTGILAMLAARIGASKVYASEMEGHMIERARHTIRSNGLDDRIRLIACNGVKTELPERVDVIASECLGHFGFDENIMKVVSDAKYLLKDNGCFVPSHIALYLAGVSSSFVHKTHISPWTDTMYGFDFSSMGQAAEERIYVTTFDKADLITEEVRCIEYEVGAEDKLGGAGEIVALEDGTLYGLAGWFEAVLAPGVVLNTSPLNESTHWEQVFLPLPEPMRIREGQSVSIRLAIRSAATTNAVNFKWGVSSESGKWQQAKAIV